MYHVLRLYLVRRTRRRIPPCLRRALVAPDQLNEMSALAFTHDTLDGGRRFRTMNLLDEGYPKRLTVGGTCSAGARSTGGALSVSPSVPLDGGPERTAQASYN